MACDVHTDRDMGWTTTTYPHEALSGPVSQGVSGWLTWMEKAMPKTLFMAQCFVLR